MAKHLVKCMYCNKVFDANSEPYVKPRSNRYAHKSCADAIEDSKDQEEKDKEALEAYIKELFGITKLTPKINQQIKKFKVNNNYSYSGMRKTLKYFFEIRGNPIEKANGGIGIIPYVYEEAHQYYFAIWATQEQNKHEEVSIQTREVHIEEPQRKPMKHIRKIFTFLDEEEGE